MEVNSESTHTTNNFDFLRFLFACLVVISHSYPLSGSNENTQWIYKATSGQMTYASIGLNGFFAISGFFIFQSMMRSRDLKDYYFKRILRLFPGLFIVLLLTLLIIPFLYRATPPLLSNPQYYTYLPNNLSLYGFQSGVKGVFDTNYYHSINGSLWTIRYEFSLYAGISLLFIVRYHKKLLAFLLITAFAVFYICFAFFLETFGSAKLFGMLGYNMLYLGTFFIAGSLLAYFQIHLIKYKNVVIVLLLFFSIVCLHFNIYRFTEHLLYSTFVLFIGFKTIPFFSTFGKIGDMSYGIYIYSFPIQQILVFYFGLSVVPLILISLVFSIIFGYFSWHLVEKRALRLKKNISILK